MEQQKAISAVIAEHFEQQIDFLRQLVRTKSDNSFSPDSSSPDVPVEKEMATVIVQELQSLGFPVVLHGVSPQRPNVLSSLSGSGHNKKILIVTTHMDTVIPSNDYTRNPWEPEIEAGRLYGLGVADSKAQIAIFIYAANALRRAGIELAGDLTLAFVVDEESGACSPYGTRYLLDQGLLHGDAVIVGEPGNDKIANAHRGLYRFRIQTRGEAIHTGLKAWEQGTRGHNAILDMARIALVLSECSLPIQHSDAFPGRKSVLTFPTCIEGGIGFNSVPDRCEAYGEVRLLPGLAADEVRSIIEEQLKVLHIKDYRLDDLISIPAVETDPGAEIVQVLASIIQEVSGVKLRVEGAGPACDGWMFITRGIPTVCGYGAACGGVHGADEWVDLNSIRSVTEIYAQTILQYLKQK
jgi:succinyl-diaminopimelate desuccinylase